MRRTMLVIAACAAAAVLIWQSASCSGAAGRQPAQSKSQPSSPGSPTPLPESDLPRSGFPTKAALRCIAGRLTPSRNAVASALRIWPPFVAEIRLRQLNPEPTCFRCRPMAYRGELSSTSRKRLGSESSQGCRLWSVGWFHQGRWPFPCMRGLATGSVLKPQHRLPLDSDSGWLPSSCGLPPYFSHKQMQIPLQLHQRDNRITNEDGLFAGSLFPGHDSG